MVPTARSVFALAATAAFLAVVSRSPAAGAAETGDVDGDGRVSLADFVHQIVNDPAAPGSLEAFSDHPCHLSISNNEYFWNAVVPLMIYLESLSRDVDGALSPWIGVSTSRVKAPPLPADPRVSVEVAPALAAGGDSDDLELEITVTTLAPLWAFSLVLESDAGVLRLRERATTSGDRRWSLQDWQNYGNALTDSYWWWPESFDGLRISVPAPAYLASGGKYVVLYRKSRGAEPIPPGETRFVTGARLPRGTPPGTYNIRLAPGSEVVFTDGTLIAPTDAGGGKIVVAKEVTTGWDAGLPPLDIDLENRRVRGAVEYRIVDSAGQPPRDGEPLLSVGPGETVPLKLQIRTEAPLNYLSYAVYWPSAALQCAGSDTLLQNPEDGQLYQRFEGNGAGCLDLAPWPSHFSDIFYLASFQADFWSTYPDRVLEYFKPLGEWVDLVEFRLQVPEWAKTEDVPLTVGTSLALPAAEFIPFGKRYACGDPWNPPDGWTYDVHFQGATVHIDSENPPPPPPPPDYEIDVVVSDAEGRPGDLVEVPVLARADAELGLLRVALAVESDKIDVEAVAVEIESQKTGEVTRHEILRGSSGALLECEPELDPADPPNCVWGIPELTFFRASEPDAIVADIFPAIGKSIEYPGSGLVEVFRLLVRIRPDATAARAMLTPAKVHYELSRVPAEAETGGTLALGVLTFSPARKSTAGTITIRGNEQDFVRGDANIDGRVDLSDAVATLGFLFLGTGRIDCPDAADADDSGALQISDPIFLLGSLFLGKGDVPAPYPSCGRDGSVDDLGCARGGCP